MTITLGDPHVRNRSTGHIYFIITIFIIFFKDNIIHKKPTKYIKYNIIVGMFKKLTKILFRLKQSYFLLKICFILRKIVCLRQYFILINILKIVLFTNECLFILFSINNMFLSLYQNDRRLSTVDNNEREHKVVS